MNSRALQQTSRCRRRHLAALYSILLLACKLATTPSTSATFVLKNWRKSAQNLTHKIGKSEETHLEEYSSTWIAQSSKWNERLACTWTVIQPQSRDFSVGLPSYLHCSVIYRLVPVTNQRQVEAKRSGLAIFHWLELHNGRAESTQLRELAWRRRQTRRGPIGLITAGKTDLFFHPPSSSLPSLCPLLYPSFLCSCDHAVSVCLQRTPPNTFKLSDSILQAIDIRTDSEQNYRVYMNIDSWSKWIEKFPLFVTGADLNPMMHPSTSTPIIQPFTPHPSGLRENPLSGCV